MRNAFSLRTRSRGITSKKEVTRRNVATDPYDIEAIRASLIIDCPHRNAILGPADYMHLDGEGTQLRHVYRPGFFLIGIASNDDEQQG